MTTPLEAAKRLQAYIDRSQCRLSIDADLKTIVNHILAKPAPFKVGDRVRAKCLVFPTGMATQLIDKGTECTVAAIHSARHLIFTLGGYRYPADCFELVTEPEPGPIATEPVVDGGSPESGEPQHDGSMWRDSFCRTERDRKAWHLVCVGIPPDEAFARVDSYLALASNPTEAARREKETT